MADAALRGKATAFAPASVGNVGVGFDVLGHAVDAAGDTVSVRRIEEPVVRIGSIEGLAGGFPTDPAANTATVGLMEMRSFLDLPFGFEVDVVKGIPLGSGMGGSAASAVASVVAANALLDRPLKMRELFPMALAGEAVASGSAHPDNVAPSLFGGMVLAAGDPADPTLVQVPVPEGVRCVLVHPHLKVATRDARSVLKDAYPLADVVAQTAHLAGFIAGCYSSDLAVIAACLDDRLIEPQRRALIPGFDAVKAAALSAGALGCSISGGGPSVFAWCDSEATGHRVGKAMVAAFAARDVGSDLWISPIESVGARLV